MDRQREAHQVDSPNHELGTNESVRAFVGRVP